MDINIKPTKPLWAVTLKNNDIPSDLLDHDYYRRILSKWSDRGIEFLDYAYEYDEKGRLHLHGTVTIPPKLYRKSLNEVGLHYMLIEVDDIVGWNRYVHKSENKDGIIEMKKDGQSVYLNSYHPRRQNLFKKYNNKIIK